MLQKLLKPELAMRGGPGCLEISLPLYPLQAQSLAARGRCGLSVNIQEYKSYDLVNYLLVPEGLQGAHGHLILQLYNLMK